MLINIKALKYSILINLILFFLINCIDQQNDIKYRNFDQIVKSVNVSSRFVSDDYDLFADCGEGNIDTECFYHDIEKDGYNYYLKVIRQDSIEKNKNNNIQNSIKQCSFSENLGKLTDGLYKVYINTGMDNENYLTFRVGGTLYRGEDYYRTIVLDWGMNYIMPTSSIRSYSTDCIRNCDLVIYEFDIHYTKGSSEFMFLTDRKEPIYLYHKWVWLDIDSIYDESYYNCIGNAFSGYSLESTIEINSFNFILGATSSIRSIEILPISTNSN